MDTVGWFAMAGQGLGKPARSCGSNEDQ